MQRCPDAVDICISVGRLCNPSLVHPLARRLFCPGSSPARVKRKKEGDMAIKREQDLKPGDCASIDQCKLTCPGRLAHIYGS